jgi:RNA polymerase sigma-70 factor (ECF subfamily)
MDHTPVPSCILHMLDPTTADEVAKSVQSHHAALVRVAARRLGDPDVAEDCVQDVWLTVLPHWHIFRSNASRWTWLYRVTRNRAMSLLRCSER